jgi:ferredoxin
MIKFDIQDRSGNIQTLELPEDINLSLMEVLKASEYPIAATCGGMALCATCHIEIDWKEESPGPANDAELEMIDTLPNATEKSRLACQLRLGKHLEGSLIRLMED